MPDEELVEAIQKQIGPFELKVLRHENYSGEHREWYETITFPKNCTDTPQIIRAIIPLVQQAERADVVAWLRSQADDPSEVISQPERLRLRASSDAIERGEYKTGGSDAQD